jgi:putative peptide zinc metalloprotease protein
MPDQVREPGSVVLRARTDLKVECRRERGRPFWFVEDPLRGTFFRLGPAEYSLFSACDGIRTLADAAAQAAAAGSDDALDLVQAAALAKWLVETGLATTDSTEGASSLELRDQTRRRERLLRANPLFFRITLGSPDRWLTRAAPLGRLIASRAFFWAWSAAALAAVAITLGHWSALTERMPLSLGWRGGLQLLVIWSTLKLLHETAHALACRQVGGTVGLTGLAFVLGIPSPFVDVSSVWRQTDYRKRIFVSLAGVYVETFAASAAILVWYASSDAVVRQLALATALLAGVSTLVFNLNPLMRFDGYFVLADLAEMPNLAGRAGAELARIARRYLLGLEEPAPEASNCEPRWLIAYGAAAVVWRAFVAIGLFSLAYYKFGPIGGACVAAVPMGMLCHRGHRAVRRLSAGIVDVRATRVVASWSALAAATVVVWIWADPLVMEVPAVVEYDPLGVVRAEAPGFVCEVLVSEGESVEKGRPLVRLKNPDLAAELEETRLTLQQHVTRSRMHRQSAAIAKEQAELRLRDAVEAKLRHLTARSESLVVRAPHAGRVVSRGLGQLVGRRLAEGDEVLCLGDERSKQVIAALPQSALEAFRSSPGKPVLRISGRGDRIDVEMPRTEPRATSEVIHPALSVENGGTVPVRRRNKDRAAGETEQATVAELYEPHFRLQAALDPATAERLFAGRTAMLEVRVGWREAAAHWWSGWERRLMPDDGFGGSETGGL